jgi:oligopeptide transport system substrate-binding protein
MKTYRIGLVLALSLLVALVFLGHQDLSAAESVFRIFMVGDARHLDPHLASDFPTATVAYLLHLRLVNMDGKGNVLPMGAGRWEVTGGGLVYTFHLNPKAKFHSGRSVTAEDWKWSFERLADPKTGSGAASVVLGGVAGFDEVRGGDITNLAGVRVINPTTLQIALKPEGRGGFLNRLTSYNASVLNKEEVEEGGRNWYEKSDAGAGPFRLVRWDRNSRFVFAAFKDFALGAPSADSIEMPIVSSATTRLNLYESGQLDVADVPLPDFKRVSEDSRLKGELKVFPRAQILFLGLNPAVYEPFKDVRVRRAIAMSIDRDRIARSVFQGFYTPARGIVPLQVPGTDANLKGLPYDPGAAKKLLAESEWAGRLPALEMAINPAAPDYQMIAEPVAAMLKEHLGVEVRLLRQEFAAYQAALNRRNVFASFLQGWSAAFLDYSYYLDLMLHSKSGLNRTNYENPAFDRLLAQANSARSEAEREAAYRTAEQLAVEDATMVPVVFSRFAMVVKPYVRGFEGSPLSLGWTDLTKIGVDR